MEQESLRERHSEDALLFLSVSSVEQPFFVTQPPDLSSYPPLSPEELWSTFDTVHRKQIVGFVLVGNKPFTIIGKNTYINAI